MQSLPPPPPSRAPAFLAEWRRFPATFTLVFVNIVVFVVEQLLKPDVQENFVVNFALIPARFNGAANLRAAGISNSDFASPAVVTIFTSLFLHGGITHILFNMFALYGIGRIVEAALGTGRFLVLYFVAGIGSGIACLLGYFGQVIPVVGASGAIYGILAGYLLMLPPGPNRTRSVLWLLAFTFVPLVLPGGGGFAGLGQIAVWGHVGGFLVGLLVMQLFIRQRRFPRPPTHAEVRYSPVSPPASEAVLYPPTSPPTEIEDGFQSDNRSVWTEWHRGNEKN